MSTEENPKTEQQKIRELLEEAAKRHREIEEKIHPEKFGVQMSDDNGKNVPTAETKEMDLTEKNETGITSSTVIENIANPIQEPVKEQVNDQMGTAAETEDLFSAEEIELSDTDIEEKPQPEKLAIMSDAPVESKSVLDAIESIISRHRDEDEDSISEEDSTKLVAKEELKDNEIAEDTLTEKEIVELVTETISAVTDETEEQEQTIAEQIVAEHLEEAEIPEVKLTVPPEKFITDFDTYLFSKGTFYKVYEKLGAHPVTLNGEQGVNFATWAPNAKEIFVIGEFNGWQESDNYRMESLGGCGLWSVFIPGLKAGDSYKFSIRSWADEIVRRKADPYAFRSEVRPKNASIVADINLYKWNDNDWIERRSSNSFKDEPMNIYEVHLGSWRRDWNNSEYPNEWGYLSYGQLAHEIVAYVKKMGYTHIELLPVMEHPLDVSWGYQVTHYYAPSSRFGQPDDFMYFVDYCHQNGIGVILDWVPAHFPYDDHALAYFDGRQIYAYENIKRGIHKDWGTYIFDYGRPEVQNFLIGSALFWLEKYHADGLRVDAVASMLYLDYSREAGEWEPNIHGGREHLEAIAFLKHLNEKVHEYNKGALMIAEESTSWPGVSHPVSEGGLGFDMKWNMGWMNDILLYFSKDPVYRKFHQGKITFSLWYAFSENFVLPISHDEVVHGKRSLLEKMPGDNWQKFANLRLFLGFMAGHPGKKLNFMTTDIAQYNEWNCETSIDWGVLDLDLNQKLNRFVKDLNGLYKEHPSLFEVDFSSDGFHWIDFSDSLHSVLSFIRTSKDKKETLLFTFNMTPTVRYDYPVGVPEAGYWKEIMNSDAEIYGGSGVGNMGGKQSEATQVREWQNSIKVNLPPLGVNIFVIERK